MNWYKCLQTGSAAVNYFIKILLKCPLLLYNVNTQVFVIQYLQCRRCAFACDDIGMVLTAFASASEKFQKKKESCRDVCGVTVKTLISKIRSSVTQYHIQHIILRQRPHSRSSLARAIFHCGKIGLLTK